MASATARHRPTLLSRGCTALAMVGLAGLTLAGAESGGRSLQIAATSLGFAGRGSWWETTAFRLMAMATAIAALIWTIRQLVLLRMRARLRGLEQERAIELERRRIARDIHDQLGANLTQIAITGKLLTLDPPERVREHGAEIVAIARATVESLDEIVWAVNPANDTLKTLVNYIGQYAVNFLAASRIACEVDMPENLPPSPLPAAVRHHLFLATKEALNNAARHAGATRVQLKIEVEEERVRIGIDDNGDGFDPAQTKAADAGDGLFNLRARMAELDGECRVVSAPGKGTRVVFELRLPPAAI